MYRLFERIADHHDGLVQAEEIRHDYLRLLIHTDGHLRARVEIRAKDAVSPDGEPVPLVCVGYPDDGEPVLVSPIPSAILAVALR